MSHALRADRLLIRPTSVRQTGTGLLARTDPPKTPARGQSRHESQTESTGTSLNTIPDALPDTSGVKPSPFERIKLCVCCPNSIHDVQPICNPAVHEEG
jgi:hypothetical protein